MRISGLNARVRRGAAVSGEFCGVGRKSHREVLLATSCSKEVNGSAWVDLSMHAARVACCALARVVNATCTCRAHAPPLWQFGDSLHGQRHRQPELESEAGCRGAWRSKSPPEVRIRSASSP